MVVFNELRILPGNNCIVVDVKVPEEEYFKNLTIDAIQICTQDKFKPNEPYSIPSELVYDSSVNFPDGNFNKQSLGGWQSADGKHVKLYININSLRNANIEKDLFFVYVKTKGIPLPNTPCGMDREYTLGLLFNWKTLYDKAIGYIREIPNKCNLPEGFLDFILRFNAFKYAVLCADYITAIAIWKDFNKFFVAGVKHSCGCR